MADAPFTTDGPEPTVPSPARLYDYYLGGKHNFEVDRVAAEKIRAKMPELGDAAWANRGFHQRAARFIASQDVRQFIDIGSGLPTTGNTHDVVQKTVPNTRVVYVDMDPLVELYSKDILKGQGTVGVILADMRDPDAILNDPRLRELIDLDKPVGLLMTAVWHFVSPAAKPHDLLKRYLDALAPGSYLALSHISGDQVPPSVVEAIVDVYENAVEQAYFRTKAEIASFFDGLEIVPPYDGAPPAVATVGLWGAEDPELADGEDSRLLYAAVGRLP
ncbi:MAG: SAM-dependent methyltransferase [Streptosporangiaceae bacterium]|jgi:SAM-dependent methyltransferase